MTTGFFRASALGLALFVAGCGSDSGWDSLPGMAQGSETTRDLAAYGNASCRLRYLARGTGPGSLELVDPRVEIVNTAGALRVVRPVFVGESRIVQENGRTFDLAGYDGMMAWARYVCQREGPAAVMPGTLANPALPIAALVPVLVIGLLDDDGAGTTTTTR
jgi:hypothetical protein